MAKANHSNLHDLTGKRYGKLVVVSRAPSRKAKTRWNCLCDCGTETTVDAYNMTSGKTRSCGCSYATQGRQTQTREWGIWSKMKERCYNPRWRNFKFYGAKGVCICQHWRESFANYIADMGRAPSLKHTMDRIDASGHYSCGHCDECKANGWTANCRWATKAQQSQNNRRNLRATLDGKTLLLKEWAKLHGVTYLSLYAKLNRGWTLEEALKAKPGQRRNSLQRG